MNNLFGRLRQFDAYSKPLEDFRVKTLSGGAVTLVSSVVMVALFVGELRGFLRAETGEELFVDSSMNDEDRVEIRFDITFHAMPCACTVVMVTLFVGELRGFLRAETGEELFVDSSMNDEDRVEIRFDITFHAMPCACTVVMVTLFVGELRGFLRAETGEELFVDSSMNDEDRVEIRFDITFHAMPCACTVVMVTLFVGELRGFLRAETGEELFVDSSMNDEDRVEIRFDITFHAMPCACTVVMVTLFVSELRGFLCAETGEELFVDLSMNDEDRVEIRFDITFHAMPCACTVVMVALFVGELRCFLRPETGEELFVDSSVSDEDRVEIASTSPSTPCLALVLVTVDAMDTSGEHQSDLQHNVWKNRLDKKGKRIPDRPLKEELNRVTTPSVNATKSTEVLCGSCYGAETPELRCCNTCEEVQTAYRRRGWALADADNVQQCKTAGWARQLSELAGEGCRVAGSVNVSKFDTSHTVQFLSFGKPYPGQAYPLNGHVSTSTTGGIMFQYYLKIVPTMYVFLNQSWMLTNQFSVTKHHKAIHTGAGDGLPGFFLQYEFSPLMVKLTEQQRSLTHFLVSICAIIGGVFTVASMIDSLIYHSSRVLQQKMDLGKAT